MATEESPRYAHYDRVLFRQTGPGRWQRFLEGRWQSEDPPMSEEEMLRMRWKTPAEARELEPTAGI